MITQLRLENFKSWQAATLDFSKLNILFGANSSGKTAVLQALLLLKQTFDSRVILNLGGNKQSYVDFGSFQEVVSGHLNGMFRIGIERDIHWRDPNNIARLLDLPSTSDTVNLDFVWEKTRLESGIDFSVVEPQTKAIIKHQQPLLEFLLYTFLDDVEYLGPIREAGRRAYLFSGVVPQQVGSRGENAIEILISQTKEIMSTIPLFDELFPVSQDVTKWITQLGIIDNFEVRSLDPERRFFEPRLRLAGSDTDAALVDVGFGVSQVLPVLVMLASAPKGSTLLIEHPELHLHPAAQSALGDVLIEAVKERDLQLIIESHSEHLLRRIQRRIAEDVISRDDVALYHCRNENGASIAERLQLDESGNIRNWIKGFFADDALLEDMFAVAQASIKEQGQSRS